MTSTTSTTSPSKTTYSATCHCARYRYTISTPALTDPSVKIARCNCSICTRNGYLLIYPELADVNFTQGSIDELKSYGFKKMNAAHRFCGECGSSLLITIAEKDFVALNVSFPGGWCDGA